MATMESPPSYQQQQRQRRQPPTKLQFLVLGAAGAGKTSILRRYFYKTFQDGSRLPTLGSDFYAGRVAYPGSTPTPTHTTEAGAGEGEDTEQSQQQQHEQQQQGVEIRLQMWDTPGRERFASKRRLRYETSLSDSFFRQADAIMLVYDMTNSTSFTQLLGWYADLVEMKHKMKEIGRVLPIMIVANKLDIFQSDKDRRRDAAPHYPQHDIDEQRDVLGLRGTFRGNDFRYEYRVSHVNSNAQTELRKSGGGSSGSSSSNRMEISSFLANRENWTTDGSYLDSLLNSEEGSHPDIEMVLLWCMRNGLKHFEVSAATGQGVDTAIDALVALALESRNKNEDKNRQPPTNNDNSNGNGNSINGNSIATPTASAAPANGAYSYQRNQKLDLHQRYAPKEDPCFFLRPVIRWFQKN